MCESYNEEYKTNYKCLMPTNTFGPNDNYDPKNSHFVPALIRKVYETKNLIGHRLNYGEMEQQKEKLYM